MSKVCPHCQQEVEQEDRPFCPHCGYAFDIDVRLAMEMQKFLKERSQQEKKTTKQVNQIAPAFNGNNNESYDYSRLHRKESTATTGILIAIAIVCVIIMVAVFLLLR